MTVAYVFSIRLSHSKLELLLTIVHRQCLWWLLKFKRFAKGHSQFIHRSSIDHRQSVRGPLEKFMTEEYTVSHNYI